MALSKNDMKNSFISMFTTKPNPITMVQHFNDFSKLYDDYAKNATELAGGNGLDTTGKLSFTSTMAAYALLPNATLLDYGDFIGLACIAYWNNSTFRKTTPPPGMASITTITITAMDTTSLKTDLEQVLNSANGNVTVLATGMSDLIHDNTKTVKVTISGMSTAVPPVPITISNVGIT